MKTPRVSLEQWRALQAVVDHGGYAHAARALHRSQSSVSYTIARLQEQLGVPMLEIRGRKAELTDAGRVLLHRARQLLADAAEIEELAASLEQGWEPEIRLVVDEAFPKATLMTVLKRFAPEGRGTRVQLREVVLSGASDALLGGADLVVGYQVPEGFVGEPLVEVEFVPVAHPEHALHRLGNELTVNDLSREMQVVVRDSGVRQQKDVGWLGAGYRWTVSSLDTAITAVSSGLGFAWLPRHEIAAALEEGRLRPLPLRGGQCFRGHLYLVFGRQDGIGPATRRLAELFREETRPLQEPAPARNHAAPETREKT